MSEKIRRISVKTSPNKVWWTAFAIICVATFATRFYKVLLPDHVCWDETHFGKMASWYINRTLFFDVHPPLGKMLIALSGKLTGYNGTFPFETPGDKYNGARYEGMRIFCTTLGALTIPLTFLTLWEMTKSLEASFLGAILLLFDVGYLTLNRYILLDPILLFFMSCCMYGAFKVRSLSQQRVPAQAPRLVAWLAWLGGALACVASVKFVGLFAVAFVGARTVADLWDLLADLTRPAHYTLKHFAVRCVTLILWPIALYVFIFWIHLTVLNRSGNGDGFYSPGFQAWLRGNSLHGGSGPRGVALGARVSLRGARVAAGYLHSHHHLYPEGVGARQQQITAYTHKDDNNYFIIKPYDSPPPATPVLVRSGSLVRLTHVPTGRNLHAHRHPAPVSSRLLQVTGYGEDGEGDANDVWRVLIPGAEAGSPLLALRSRFQLVHALQGCALSATGAALPAWGYEQHEVACSHSLRDTRSHWIVEENHHDGLPKVSFDEIKASFLERFVEAHAVMFQGNSGLKPKEGEVVSQPWQWPINYKGQYFSGAGHRVYLLGNPLVWWGNLALLALHAPLALRRAAARRRRSHRSTTATATATEEKSKEDMLMNAAGWCFLGWALHYVPFWTMGRILYFHHYFPALVFSCMLSGILIEYILTVMKRFLSPEVGTTVCQAVYGIILCVILHSFYMFAPLTYGMDGPLAHEPNSTMHGLKWLDSWDF